MATFSPFCFPSISYFLSVQIAFMLCIFSNRAVYHASGSSRFLAKWLRAELYILGNPVEKRMPQTSLLYNYDERESPPSFASRCSTYLLELFETISLAANLHAQVSRKYNIMWLC